MLASVRHRGPDDEGWAVASDSESGAAVALATARLAVLDLSPAGHQPFEVAGSGLRLVFNGEVYNHREVRAELGGLVERWTSEADTETVFRAFEAWGPECLSRLRGMFALAVWDPKAGELWCARDRLGIKPLYYYQGTQEVVYASEVRALLASGCVPREVDRAGLAGFVRFGCLPEPRTLLAGVRSLPAGHWMRSKAGRVTDVRSYWEPGPRRQRPGSSVREALGQSVQEHLLADVPVACFLSGGLDSSVITALAAEAAPGRLQTVTLALDDPGLDESEHARRVADHCQTEHHEVRLSLEEVAAIVPEATRALDLPSADGINTYIVSKAVADLGFKVVLSGLGGDELFGGYRSFRLLPRAARVAPLTRALPRALKAWAAGSSGRRQRAVDITAPGLPLRERYEHLRAYWSSRELEALGVERVGLGGVAPGAGWDPASRVGCLELTGYMRSTLLRDSDAMSMACGLELRVPFLDHRLVELCFALGVAGRSTRGRPKGALQDVAESLLPRATLRRKKQGFALPWEEWLRGPLEAFAGAGLEVAEASGLIPGLRQGRLLERFRRGDLPWARLWQFAVLGHWLERHVG